MLIRGALGNGDLPRQYGCGWKRTPKEPSGPPAPGIPPARGCARQSDVPSPGMDLLSHQSTGLTNFPMSLKTCREAKALMADASTLTPAFAIVFAVGSAISFPHWTWP